MTRLPTFSRQRYFSGLPQQQIDVATRAATSKKDPSRKKSRLLLLKMARIDEVGRLHHSVSRREEHLKSVWLSATRRSVRAGDVGSELRLEVRRL